MGDEKEGESSLVGVGSALARAEMMATMLEDTAEQLSEGYSKMIREEYSEMLGEAYNEETNEEQIKEFMYMIIDELEERAAEVKARTSELS